MLHVWELYLGWLSSTNACLSVETGDHIPSVSRSQSFTSPPPLPPAFNQPQSSSANGRTGKCRGAVTAPPPTAEGEEAAAAEEEEEEATVVLAAPRVTLRS